MARRIGRPPKYDWDLWLDGRDKLLEPAPDTFLDTDPLHYDRGTKAASLTQQIRLAARRRDVNVQVTLVGDGGAIGLKFGEKGRGRSQRYDWDKLLSDELTVLQQGRDFTCKPTSMRHYLYAEARARDIQISVQQRELEDGKVLIAVRRIDEKPKNHRLGHQYVPDIDGPAGVRPETASRPVNTSQVSAPATSPDDPYGLGIKMPRLNFPNQPWYREDLPTGSIVPDDESAEADAPDDDPLAEHVLLERPEVED